VLGVVVVVVMQDHPQQYLDLVHQLLLLSVVVMVVMVIIQVKLVQAHEVVMVVRVVEVVEIKVEHMRVQIQLQQD
jgi:hypothetical protein